MSNVRQSILSNTSDQQTRGGRNGEMRNIWYIGHNFHVLSERI